MSPDPERVRLASLRNEQVPWYRWGPFLSGRQWGTVREDYSHDGNAWTSLPHDHARSRAYRWGEDGLLGIGDNHGRLFFALALWNEADPILKERLFGLSGPEGNHGEDVKECYYFLDSTPTHSYMKALYKYPHRAFPYAELVIENARRGRDDPEFELQDTGIFEGDRYFDVFVEYAKADPDDILIRISMVNRGREIAPLHVLPTLWFRNTWAWGPDDRVPSIQAAGVVRERAPHDGGRRRIGARRVTGWIMARAVHHDLGEYWLACRGDAQPRFTDNESNARRLWGTENRSSHVKDAFHEAVVHGRDDAAGRRGPGTKFAAHYRAEIAPGGSEAIWLRFSQRRLDDPFEGFEEIIERRRAECDLFYQTISDDQMSEDARAVQRQAFAGLLWSKQFYFYDVAVWLDGDPAGPPPPAERRRGRNLDWRHLNNADVISMPDTWEYPWYATWDLGFHCIPLAMIDPDFAKRQIILMLREWYMHPSGQLPAYEWDFGDVNPPVHAWAAWRVYKIARRVTGDADLPFLERVFHKLMLNFTWWVNRKDVEGRNVFQGGFLGLDNIGVFDRSRPLPGGGHIDQSDGTAWMGMFCLNLLAIALELARHDRVYEDVATKFFEHFLYIAGALNNIGGDGVSLWDDEDEFFYDVLHMPDGETRRLKVRSLVGLIPLLAVETIEPDLLEALPNFRRRMEWFLEHRPGLASLVSRWFEPGQGYRGLLALARGHRMKRLLRRMLDPAEFLSDYGIRSLSRYHDAHPYMLSLGGREWTVSYEPAESRSGLFGGNSNWRGPIWFPINFLLIEAIQKFHHYYGDDFLVEHPTGSGEMRTLWQIADNLSRRLVQLFLRGPDGRRPVFGSDEVMQQDPHWRDYLVFSEYFHGDTGRGMGASHQTGWTALVAKLLDQTGRA